MYEIADRVRRWMEAGRDVRVAQVIAMRGLSSREPAAAGAWIASETGGEPPVGRLLVSADDLERPEPRLVDVSISDDEAVAAGLACGGSASVLVQPAAAYPAELWTRLAAREPVCLVTRLDRDGRATQTQLYGPQTISEAASSYADPVPRLFARGSTSAALVESAGERLAVVALWPVPTLLVVGDGLIADALVGAADLLGWTSVVTPAADRAIAEVAGLNISDAVVVLSHDRDVDGPVLAAALAGRVGYVGGLGAQHTQAARREWLTAHGVAETDQSRIHGPAGLDVGAHSPGEIAISIVAEILASRAGSSGGSLRERPGPVHRTGVSAPPPRY